MRGQDVRSPSKMAAQKFSATSHKPMKIPCYKTEKCSTANMLIFF